MNFKLELSIFDFLSLPVTLPYRSFKFILEAIKEEADKNLLNPANIQDKMLELEYIYEMNEIDHTEYLETKKILITKLREFKEEQLS